MVDYASQLAKGFAAHAKASAAKAEVKEILEELSREVEAFTGGRVGVTIKRNAASLAVELMDGFANIGRDSPKKRLTGSHYDLVAVGTGKVSGSSEKLASWLQSKDGYPCTLRFDDVKREAYDRKSLEAILGELLSSSETARVISEIAAKAVVDENENSSDRAV